MKKIRIGLVGAGTVGQGVIKILQNSSELIRERTGAILELKMVCDKNPAIEKAHKDIFTSDYQKITTHPDIDIVVELVGGTGFAFEVVKSALENKKSVVTANKALLSEKGKQLFALAKENQVEIGYEASVAGTIPIIRSIKTSLVANDFVSLYGILNGTTNFILTKMEEENLGYEEALKIAQDLGFAEKDPTFDVEGIDAAHKVSILASIAFNKSLRIQDIYVEGISRISPTEIQFARELGYRIKLLGICKKNEDKIEARVHPTMIPIQHPIANVRNEMNAVYIDTNYSGPLVFSGKGAGSLPTASAVVSDLVFYGTRFGQKDFSEKNLYEPASLVTLDESEERFYLRFNTVDRPGVISAITGVLGSHQISISSVRQYEPSTEPVKLIIITHKAQESKVRLSLEEIDKCEFIKEKSVMMRLENLP
jgi:homoserine dehydrogenase